MVAHVPRALNGKHDYAAVKRLFEAWRGGRPTRVDGEPARGELASHLARE